MKEIFKAYHLFIPGNFKAIKMILLYLLAPLAMFGICSVGVQESSGVVLGSFLCIVFSAEIFIDLGVMGGIQRKVSRQTEYLRISLKGMNLLKRALLGDEIRRAYVSIVPAVVATLIIGKDAAVCTAKTLYIAFLCFFIQEILLFITRFFDNMTMNIMIGAGFIGGSTGVLSLVAAKGAETMNVARTSDYILAICFAVLAVLMSIVRIKVTISKAKEGYYE